MTNKNSSHQQPHPKPPRKRDHRSYSQSSKEDTDNVSGATVKKKRKKNKRAIAWTMMIQRLCLGLTPNKHYQQHQSRHLHPLQQMGWSIGKEDPNGKGSKKKQTQLQIVLKSWQRTQQTQVHGLATLPIPRNLLSQWCKQQLSTLEHAVQPTQQNWQDILHVESNRTTMHLWERFSQHKCPKIDRIQTQQQ